MIQDIAALDKYARGKGGSSEIDGMVKNLSKKLKRVSDYKLMCLKNENSDEYKSKTPYNKEVVTISDALTALERAHTQFNALREKQEISSLLLLSERREINELFKGMSTSDSRISHGLFAPYKLGWGTSKDTSSSNTAKEKES